MSAIKDSVAGAARALWVNHIGASLSLEAFLKAEPGARIIWKQARLVIGEPISLLGFAMFCTERRSVADAALALWLSPRNVSKEWLSLAAPYYIRECAAMLQTQAYVAHYMEQHGSRVIAAPGSSLDESRDSAVADSAQWLWLNRQAASTDWLARMD